MCSLNERNATLSSPDADDSYAPSIRDVLFATRNQPEVTEPERCHPHGGNGLPRSASVCLVGALSLSVSLRLPLTRCSQENGSVPNGSKQRTKANAASLASQGLVPCGREDRRSKVSGWSSRVSSWRFACRSFVTGELSEECVKFRTEPSTELHSDARNSDFSLLVLQLALFLVPFS